jgi:hypothetical protein
MKLLSIESFQHNGPIKEGVTLDVSKAILLEEIKKGVHEKRLFGNVRWISGLLNHTVPANETTSQFILKNLPDGVSASDLGMEDDVEDVEEEDDANEIQELWAQFDEIGKAFDKRWGPDRLRSELLKAQKETGTTKEPAVKQKKKQDKK